MTTQRILALDLGTRCGYALSLDRTVKPLLAGEFDLSAKKDEGEGWRFIKFRRALQDAKPDIIFYEEVKRHMGVIAAHVWGGLWAELTAYCAQNKIPYKGFGVAAIKMRATRGANGEKGKGNAKKDAMIAAAKQHFGYEGNSDNVADALWILQLGLESLPDDEEAF